MSTAQHTFSGVDITATQTLSPFPSSLATQEAKRAPVSSPLLLPAGKAAGPPLLLPLLRRWSEEAGTPVLRPRGVHRVRVRSWFRGVGAEVVTATAVVGISFPGSVPIPSAWSVASSSGSWWEVGAGSASASSGMVGVVCSACVGQGSVGLWASVCFCWAWISVRGPPAGRGGEGRSGWCSAFLFVVGDAGGLLLRCLLRPAEVARGAASGGAVLVADLGGAASAGSAVELGSMRCGRVPSTSPDSVAWRRMEVAAVYNAWWRLLPGGWRYGDAGGS